MIGMTGQQRRDAFTLIELLVVISIIGLLAALTVGLTGVASRKSREARIEGEMGKLITAIENYKAKLGNYPRDNPGKPSTNQLFYELSGTIFEGGQFRLQNGSEVISADAVRTVFNAPGFGNSVRPGEKLGFTEEFKASQFAEISRTPDVEVLVVPVKGPLRTVYNGVTFNLEMTAANGTKVNPWMYDSSSPNRNNRRSFDLWADVVIGKKIIRFSNWDKGGVVIGTQ